LAGLTELKELNLVGNKISDLSPLEGLTKLRKLHLDGGIDLSPLNGLQELEIAKNL
jgi:internalin A